MNEDVKSRRNHYQTAASLDGHAARSLVGQGAAVADAEPVEKLHAEGGHWRVLAGWRQALLGPDSPDWFALEERPDTVAVKLGESRVIWQVEIQGLTVFAKIFDLTAIRLRLSQFLHLDPARREWQTARAVSRRQVPVAPCLAVGTRARAAALLTKGVAGARGLAAVWAESVDGSEGRDRCRAFNATMAPVARLLAAGHSKGFVHRDGHPNNILLGQPDQDTLPAFFIDVHGARLLGRMAPRRLSARSLAQLDQYFCRRATRAERLRFLRLYLSERPGTGKRQTRVDRRVWVQAVQRAAKAHRARLAARRDRRLRRNGKYFATIRLGDGWRATLVLTLARRHVLPESNVPDRSVADWDGPLREIMAVARTTPGGRGTNQDGTLSFEVCRLVGLVDRAAATIAGSKHRRAFETCHRRRHRDDDCPLTLGYLEHTHNGLIDTTVLIRPRLGMNRSADTDHEVGKTTGGSVNR